MDQTGAAAEESSRFKSVPIDPKTNSNGDATPQQKTKDKRRSNDSSQDLQLTLTRASSSPSSIERVSSNPGHGNSFSRLPSR